MNHIYRIVWNHATACYQAVTESAKGQGKHSVKSTTVVHGGHSGVSSAFMSLSATAIAAALCIVSLSSLAGPAGGQVTAGSATITQTGSAGSTNTTINQSSNKAAIDWSKFSVGANESVRFNQPGRNSVTLNRVTGTEASAIMGKLSANGQVFILNPNGVLFGAGSEVNVGSLVASTMRLDNANFMAGNYKFTGDANTNGTASVINNGTITVAPGGTLALMAPVVQNTGTLSTPGGSVLLAGAQAVTLTLQTDGGLVSYTLDEGSVQALVDNGGLIQANGGHVVLTAKGVDALSKAVVNHSGVIEAQTVNGKSGVIELLGDMQSGTVNVSGKLDASAPNGGDGGFIEASATKVSISTEAHITTAAPYGKTGMFLIDPTNYVIAPSGGDITGAQLSDLLAENDVVITTPVGGNQNGDIFVNDRINYTYRYPTRITVNISYSYSCAVNTTDCLYGINYGVFTGYRTAATSVDLSSLPLNYTVISRVESPDGTLSTSKLTLNAAKDIYINKSISMSSGRLALNPAASTGRIYIADGGSIFNSNIPYGIEVDPSAIVNGVYSPYGRSWGASIRPMTAAERAAADAATKAEADRIAASIAAQERLAAELAAKKKAAEEAAAQAAAEADRVAAAQAAERAALEESLKQERLAREAAAKTEADIKNRAVIGTIVAAGTESTKILRYGANFELIDTIYVSPGASYELLYGDVVSTGTNSTATVTIAADGSLIVLSPTATVLLETDKVGPGTIAQQILDDSLLWGRVLTSTGVNIGGGGLIAGVRG